MRDLVPTLYTSSRSNAAVSRPKSSGTVGSSPGWLDANSAQRKAPSVVSATSDRPNPGDLHKKQNKILIYVGDYKNCYFVFNICKKLYNKSWNIKKKTM